MKSSEEYWNNKIIEWESTYYDNNSNSNKSFFESIAGFFRKPLIERKNNLYRIIKDFVSNGTSICELGCGSGDFMFDLSKRFELNLNFIGLDISQNAITFAKKKYEKYNFIHSDLSSSNNIPQADIYFGLGFIDYLTLEEITQLIKKIENLKGKYVFSVPEKKINIINILHYIYLKVAGCPKFYKFTKNSFKKNIKNCNFIELNGQLFIKNF